MVARASDDQAKKKPYQRFQVLDALRGLAAVGVAIFHFRWTHAELQSSPVFDRLFNLLDFFFVLSGFVLAHVYLSKPLVFGDFVWRRLGRLYPLHVFALLMFLLLQLGKLSLIQLGIGTRNDAFAGMNVVNFFDTLLLLQWSGLLWHEISWNYPSWTVATELAGALTIYLLAVGFGRERLASICLVLIAGCAAYMYLWTVDPADYGPNALVRTLYGLAIGCALYRLHRHFRLACTPLWGTIAEVSAIILVAALISSPATRPLWYLVTFGLAVAVYVFAAEQGAISHACKTLQLHRLGAGSYSIYMNHALVGAIFSKLYLSAAPKLGITGYMSVAVYVPVFILILAAYSRLTLRYVERPGQQLWDRGGAHIRRMAVERLPARVVGLSARLRGLRPTPAFNSRLEKISGGLVRRYGA